MVDADPHADRRLLEAIADWCDRYTPLVGLDPPDGLVLDVTGCAHLFGGEAGAGAAIFCRRLARQGFRARPPSRMPTGCGCAVARYGALRRIELARRFIVPRGEAEAAALPLPIAALRIDAGDRG